MTFYEVAMYRGKRSMPFMLHNTHKAKYLKRVPRPEKTANILCVWTLDVVFIHIIAELRFLYLYEI